MPRVLMLASIVTVLLNPLAALAQDGNEGWRVTAGGGALFAPSYEGDDSYRLSAVPNLQLAYGDLFFASIQEGVGYRALNTETVKAGPILRFAFPRKEDGKQLFAVTGRRTSDLRGLGDVDISVEMGGFAEYETGPLTWRAEVRQAASGHKGFAADVGVQWTQRFQALSSFAILSLGPRVRMVDKSFNQAYFGVTPAQSAASGLPVYEAGGGLYAYGASSTVIFPLPSDRRWALVFVGSYERLTGDAGASPLVQRRGSRNQAMLGLFASRSF
ncbi:MAG: MipA/OmpV family protein [Rhodospirillaceae bacterium]